MSAAAPPVFKQPNKASATAIMVSATVPSTALASCTTNATYAIGSSPDGKCSHNPVNWAPTNPMPTAPAAYPIGGFTMVYAYSCYANLANGGGTTAPRLVAKTGKWGLFSWYFTDPATNLVNQKVVSSLTQERLRRGSGGVENGHQQSALHRQEDEDCRSRCDRHAVRGHPGGPRQGRLMTDDAGAATPPHRLERRL